jgi:RsiW-degrading membrane proteinase PrsW (M82 family)
MSFGSRTRLHHLARHTALLKRLALAITLFGFFGALLIIALSPDRQRYASLDPKVIESRNGWQDLQRADASDPHELARWLYLTMQQVHELSTALKIKVTTWEDYQRDGSISGLEVRGLLEKYSADPAVRQLWEAFIQAGLSREAALWTALDEKAEQTPPLITANLITAYHWKEIAPQRSLHALMREAKFYPESELVKNSAFHLAVELKDKDVLQQMADQPEWWSTMPAELRQQAAALIGDYQLQWLALMEMISILSAPVGVLGIAVLAASIWYIILILHGVRGRWRWVSPLLPLAAGILSVPPVIMIDTWQQLVLGMAEDNPFPQDLWYQIGGVGMREESMKLIMAALFMPWLLRKRPPGGALVVGAFVGLGFALEENINYYITYQGGIALARFFSANFFHAAMTAITAHALYELLRSRFGSADRFLLSFFGVVTAHGCFNYLQSAPIDGANIFSMIILVLTAWYFLDQVYLQCPVERHWITPAAVFLLGTAALMAIIFLSIAIRTPDRHLLVAAAIQCVECFPMAFIYWRRLGA